MSGLAEHLPGILVGVAVGSVLVSLWQIGDALRDIARAIRSHKPSEPPPSWDRRMCGACGRWTRASTAGCDHCDHEDK